jgi:hypothetical protein
MIRKGAQGGSAELLSSQRQQEMDIQSMAEIKHLGSDFANEEVCDQE